MVGMMATIISILHVFFLIEVTIIIIIIITIINLTFC